MEIELFDGEEVVINVGRNVEVGDSADTVKTTHITYYNKNDVYKTLCPNRCLCINVAKSTMCN